ncbi:MULTISPECIES: putative lipopolysaccharide heptosyltransferase III [unclassified Paludibacterium]|uniref:putative lipopolysaccharide heptosyltransferase III n=1 Tax=unclassified Paludibacterium TaxID=2618429 RepID=UPI001C057532|nr:putative lipopolysaccharide heptosyltransferase III [Paludibacterium sp. B53371]BEV73160.1 putative lipopolysaccharide heptosyltransferase III [Paludibacterium sp. THUN1379]
MIGEAISSAMTPPISPPARILLIKLRHHGDVLLCTPVIHALQASYPAAEIDMLLYEETRPMVQHHPGLSRIWGLDRSVRGWRRLAHWLGLYRQLARRHYDLIIHLSDQMNAALLTKALAPANSVGFDYPKRRNKYWRSCFRHLAPLAESDTLHTVEQNLLALQPLALTVSDEMRRCRMSYSSQDREHIQQQLARLGIHGTYIVAHPPARWFFKCWEDERFASVIQTLADDGWPVIVTGGRSVQEQQLVDNIMQQVRSPRVHSLAGQLSLNTLAALIDGARLFIGVDSVPMHMAAALQTDCVALFGPSKLNEWHPWMNRAIVINAADHGPLPHPDAIDTSTTQRYLSAIPAETVLNACQRLLRPQNDHPA